MSTMNFEQLIRISAVVGILAVCCLISLFLRSKLAVVIVATVVVIMLVVNCSTGSDAKIEILNFE